MIWLASFPRSGNTYMRNILFEVYGLASSTYHRETAYPVDEGYADFPVVKTHLLPGQVEPASPDIPAVLLVRDGRDAVVSLAHHRRDFRDAGAGLEATMKEAILAEEGSYFGGWSRHTEAWVERADLIIRFEDLIQHPRREVERLTAVLDLPEPNWDRLPSFEQLKHGRPTYGSGAKMAATTEAIDALTQRWFRSGKSGGWQSELPKELQALFWNHHGRVMEMLGYRLHDTGIALLPELFPEVDRKLGGRGQRPRKIQVLLEGRKLLEPQDGIHRYVKELGKALLPSTIGPQASWDIQVLTTDEPMPLASCPDLQAEHVQRKGRAGELTLVLVRKAIRLVLPRPIYRLLAPFYRRSPVRKYLASRVQIPAFDEAYDLIHIPLPQNAAPFLQNGSPLVATLHDMSHELHPSFHEDVNVRRTEEGMAGLLAAGAAWISVSQATADDFQQLAKAPANAKIRVIPLAPSDHFVYHRIGHREQRLREKLALPDEPFALCLSTLEPRKNLEAAIESFAEHVAPHMNVKLVVAGATGWKTDQLDQTLRRHARSIYRTGYVHEEDLPVLYGMARCFLFLSHAEGFGLPVLEAMRCGTPVIINKIPSLLEVAGEAAIAVDAAQPRQVGEAMQELFRNDEWHEAWRQKGLWRTAEFSWNRTANATLQMYKTTLAEK